MSLAQRADLPTRVRGLLDGMLEQTHAYFEAAVARTLDELDQSLFKLAERSNSNEEQQLRFDDLREIKRGRAEVGPRFLAHVESRLALIRAPRKSVPARPPPPTGGLHAPLALVESTAFEEDLALREIAGKSEVRHTQSLHELAHRLGVIAGTPIWTSDLLPLGPAQIAAAFHHALHDLNLRTIHRVLAFHEFDRVAMLPIGPFYEKLNAYLAERGVLPNLQIFPGRRHAPAESGRTSESAQDKGADETPSVSPNRPSPPVQQQRPYSAPEHAASRTQAPPSAEDGELFNALRNLLHERRRSEGMGEPVANPQAQHASRDDLQSLLGTLQQGAPPSTASGKSAYDSEHFKNTLMVKLRRASPQGRPMDLGEEDSDTVDLVGMLFDYITRNVREDSGARSLLTRLHVPVLRVALGDKTFFTRRNHPARELLNTIAETGTRWLDDSESDPDLTSKMQMVVDHVGSEFNGDVAVFEKLLVDLNAYMQLIARRAEVVERRHIDAAKGRDKLEVARGTAESAIVRIIQSGSPTPMVRALLEKAWTDALALSVLRQGEGGGEFQRRLEIAEKLAHPVEGARLDETMANDLDSGLRQVGLHVDDVQRVRESLFPRDGAANDESSENLELIADALQGTTRLGSEADKTVAPAAEPAPPLSEEEKNALAHLHKTPFGTWFEFTVNQQGQSTRRKLAWFSPMTGRCLFVTQRGARAEDKTLDQLARDVVRGHARAIIEERTTLMDRAWKTITDTLRPNTAAKPKKAEA